ncbi:MAG TPA: DotU family type IV/VI secretion system protein [Lacipirellulaceae bacterium]
MTPNFAQAVDPIYLYVLALLDRISRSAKIKAHDERSNIRRLIDEAEARLGFGTEWELAKYALVSWIDEMLVETAWEGRDWWGNNVLEIELFNSRECNEKFFVKARQASTITGRDALEVFYVCVILGFRGLYQDPISGAAVAQTLNMPTELNEWARQTALSIRLGQGRDALAAPGHEITGAPPLRSRAAVVWPWLAVTLLASTAFLILYHTYF